MQEQVKLQFYIVSIPHRYSTNRYQNYLKKKSYLVSIPHRYSTNLKMEKKYQTNMLCFNPSQVFYKQILKLRMDIYKYRFNPSQVFYKLDWIIIGAQTNPQFQSLIGILQTKRIPTRKRKFCLFQSLIGILQTSRAHPSPAVLNCRFNPSQVFYKHP